MKETEWETVVAEIDGLPADAVEESRVPMPIYLQEANDLQVVTTKPDVRESLIKVGVNKDSLDRFGNVITLVRDRQSNWVVVRDRSKSDAQVQREAEGRTMRSELVQACRWHLRSDSQAQRALDDIMDGDGVEDMIQDLESLGMLVEKHSDAFGVDETWDWKTTVETARALASEIRAGKSEAVADLTHEDAKLKRDQAFTYLHGLVEEIRGGGRWAYRNDNERLTWFGSEYTRRRSRAQRAKTRAESGTVSS